jgi:chromosome transmission fidelity protein 1
MTDYTNHLFAYADKDRIRTLSCSHVIPPENLVAWTISSGVSRGKFEFTFDKRNAPNLVSLQAI